MTVQDAENKVFRAAMGWCLSEAAGGSGYNSWCLSRNSDGASVGSWVNEKERTKWETVYGYCFMDPGSVKIGHLFQKTGAESLWTVDFEDKWSHSVECVDVLEPRGGGTPTPRVESGVGRCPPELARGLEGYPSDVSASYPGPAAYQEFLNSLPPKDKWGSEEAGWKNPTSVRCLLVQVSFFGFCVSAKGAGHFRERFDV